MQKPTAGYSSSKRLSIECQHLDIGSPPPHHDEIPKCLAGGGPPAAFSRPAKPITLIMAQVTVKSHQV